MPLKMSHKTGWESQKGLKPNQIGSWKASRLGNTKLVSLNSGCLIWFRYPTHDFSSEIGRGAFDHHHKHIMVMMMVKWPWPYKFKSLSLSSSWSRGKDNQINRLREEDCPGGNLSHWAASSHLAEQINLTFIPFWLSK